MAPHEWKLHSGCLRKQWVIIIFKICSFILYYIYTTWRHLLWCDVIFKWLVFCHFSFLHAINNDAQLRKNWLIKMNFYWLYLKHKTGMWTFYENTCQPHAKYIYRNRYSQNISGWRLKICEVRPIHWTKKKPP